MAPESPYMRAADAARHLQFLHADGTPNVKAFYAWRYRHPELRAMKRGRTLLFKRADLDAVLERERAHLDRFLESKRGRVA